MDNPDEKPKQTRRRFLRRPRGAGCGCLAIIGFTLGAIVLCVVPILVLTSVVIEQTWFLPGDASHFDPVAAYPRIQQHAGEGSLLISIEARYVRSDGTLDLYASYRPTVEYQFVRDAQPPSDAPPLGAGGATGSQKWYEPIQVDVYQPGQFRDVTTGSSEYQFVNLGMDRDASSVTSTLPGEIIPTPACSFTDLWQLALKRGTPADAVATIRYDSDGYSFDISSTSFEFKFDNDCKLQEEGSR